MKNEHIGRQKCDVSYVDKFEAFCQLSSEVGSFMFLYPETVYTGKLINCKPSLMLIAQGISLNTHYT